MDQHQFQMESQSNESSSPATERLSLLELASVQSDQNNSKQNTQEDAKEPSFEDFERTRALNALRNLMQPIDSKLSCDIKPQVPSIRPLQNTCGIDLQRTFEKVNKSTVKVMSANQETGGSGFYACSTDKSFCAVVTNDHVVKKASDLSNFMLFQEGVGASSAEVLLQDTKNDLALLQIKSQENPHPLFPQTDLKPVQWAPNLAAGESVFTVCNPTKATFSTFVSPGKVTATNEIPIITDAPNSPRSIISEQQNYFGCSGGATFNRFGELVGIVRAVGAGQMVNIKTQHLQKLLDDEARRIRGW
jgi:S1-C subfamily serine protease